MVGDSLSAAYKLSAEQGWVYLLEQELLDAGMNVEFINASVSGMTTAGGLQVMPDALKQHQPQIVVIELGANDGLQGKPVPYITANLERLISLAKAEGEVVLAGIRLPPNRGKRYVEPFFAQYAQLAEEHETYLVPFLLDGVAGHADKMMDDGLHPNAVGQQTIVQVVKPELTKVLQKIPTNRPAEGASNL